MKNLILFTFLFLSVFFSWGQNVSTALQQITPSYKAGLIGESNAVSTSLVALTELGIQQNAALVSDEVNSQLLPPSNQHLPYPIIFIHGLNSSSLAWQDQRTAFENLGLTYGGIFRACLNYDGNVYSSNKWEYPIQGADIAYWDIAVNETPGDFYFVNFNVDNFGRVSTDQDFNDVLSNESAIAKQGVALRRIISRVLLITGRDKVVLMGHSMGGLAAREYVQNTSNWQSDGQHHVAKLVTTGTPHGGYEGLGLSTDINFRSEAFRDLKTSYNFGGNGVYLFGGYELYSVMYNNLIYPFYNVDVNCNGIDADGTDIVGLNEKPWWTNLDYSYIIGDCIGCPSQGLNYGDGVVQMVNANLSNFTNGLPAAKNEFVYTAASTMLHTVLPQVISENMKGLDEPNEYALSYGIDFNVEYTGFISKPSNMGYPYDYDDYVFELPISASIDLTTYSNYFVDIPFRILNSNGVVYSGIMSPNSSGSFFTQELAAGTYYLEFYLHQSYIADNSYLYPYRFEIDIAPVVSIFAASSTTICAGSCISFTDNTSNSPNSWDWIFSGADNTTSNQQNPSNVCYNTPGTYSVSLTTSNGYSTDNTSIAGYVTVLAQPAPVITQNANTMSSSSSSGNQWYLNNTPIAGATGQTYSPTASGTYYVQVTNSNGCSENSAPFNFAYTPAPIAQFQANLNQVCAGECIVFTDNSSNQPTNWSWVFQGGTPSSSSSQTPSSICYQIPGTYFVSLTVSNAGGSDVQTSSGYITVTATPSIPTISGNGNQLTSSASQGNQWYLNNTLIAGATGQTYSPSVSGTYYVQVTNSNGCSENSAPFNFIYTPAPIAQFQANLSQVCAGECIVFTDNSSNQPTNWSWVFQGGTPSSSSSQTPSTICYQIPGTYFVSLTVSNAGGSDVQTSSGYITVTATPSIPTISGNGNQLTSSASQGNQWYLNNAPISGATGQTYSPTASGTYYVQVTNSNGCSVMSQPFVFVYTNAPFAAFSTQNNDQALCVGDCINFLDQSANSPTSWQWSFPGGTPSSSTAQNPSNICYNNSGDYLVALTVSNAGGSDAITTNAYITVVNDPQTPIITVDGNMLTSSSNSGNQWYLNGAAITGAIGQTHLATQSGNYSVIVTNASDCSSSSTPVNLTVTDIEEVNSESESLLYPNPSSGLVMVQSADRIKLIEVFDLSGKLLLSTTDQQFDLSPFAEGVYVIRLHGDSAVINQKLIKTK